MRIGALDSARLSSSLLGGLGLVARPRAMAFPQPLFSGNTFSISVPDRLGAEPSSHGFDHQLRARIGSLIDEIRDLVSHSGDEIPNGRGSADAESASRPAASWRVNGPPTRLITTTTFRGVNGAQLAGAAVFGLRPGSRLIISGEISQAARPASLTVRGDQQGLLTAGGTYELVGTSGRVTLNLAAGESLADVADRVNDKIATTGVVAAVVGHDLTLTSVGLGSGASVELRPLALQEQRQTSGVNPAQVQHFEIGSLTPGFSETLFGEYLGPAESAELVYVGEAGSIVSGTATFRLSGTRGETFVTLTAGESLAGVAARINQNSEATGVVAAVEGNTFRLSSDAVGSAATVRVDQVQVAYDTSVSGVNASQVAGFHVLSLAEGSEHVIGGEVTRVASKAALSLEGSGSGTVIDSATFRLSGSLGSAVLAIAEGESLAAVAGRVNAAVASTGVTASAAGNQLIFESLEVGSSATVDVELLEVAHTTVVSGVNAQQLASFSVNSFTTDASHALSGSITQTADKAELTFTSGLGSLVGTTANITLSGSTGSVQLSVSFFQSVSSFATAVNQHTATTGVTATVQGNQVKLRSVGVGSAATVAVQVNSGSFQVTGGNGNGTANGANAIAVINGQTITGAGNQFQFADSLGSYQFAAVPGFTGAISPIAIDSVAGSFELSGGNGDGTASGLDALAVIDGTALTGVGNRFAISRPGSQFELEIASGFTGELDAITVRSTPHEFTLEGGDGAGSAIGRDATAIVNGTEYASSDGRFSIAGQHGNYTIQFDSQFSGSFDPITVTSTLARLTIVGGDGAGWATGSDAQGVINEQAVLGVGDQLRLVDQNRFITLLVQPGFTGRFDTITAERRVRAIQDESDSATRPAVPLPNSAPEDSDLSADRLDQLLDELRQLTQAGTTGGLLATALAVNQASRSVIINQQFAEFVRASSLATAAALDPREFTGHNQLRRLVDLLA